jgi:UDP-glucose 4-epimerase
MKLLVTGGAGFIGSHLVDALIERGDDVVVFDDFSSGSQNNLMHHIGNPQISIVPGNILNREDVFKVMRLVDGCFHMAAAVGVEKILKDPIGSIKSNVHGSENVLDAATENEVPVILASTSEIYGKNSSEILHEESDRILGSPLLSRWTYSEAKALDEAYARALYERAGLKVKIVRFFNTVGPRQSSAYGMVIPKFFEAAVTNSPLVVHGDGTQQRIFCHVEDAIRGVLALWDSPGGFGEAFNLGGFEEIRILDLAHRIIQISSSTSEIEFIEYSKLRVKGFEDIARRLPDTRKLQMTTGWNAIHGLDRILSDYYQSILNK